MRPPLRERTAFERGIADSTLDLIVRCYAITGKLCQTAKLIFFGPENPTAEQRKFGGKAPGKLPEWLAREMKAARAEHLANPPRLEFDRSEVA